MQDIRITLYLPPFNSDKRAYFGAKAVILHVYNRHFEIEPEPFRGFVTHPLTIILHLPIPFKESVSINIFDNPSIEIKYLYESSIFLSSEQFDRTRDD